MKQNLKLTFKRKRGRPLTFLRSRVAVAEDAEDILQDVFLQAVRNLNVTQPIDNLLGWLYTAAKNRIVDWYRRKRRAVPLHSGDDELSLDELLADSAINVEKDFLRSVVLEAVIDGLADLLAEQREVFIAQAIEGRTFREIADETGTSINTLLARKRYAVRFLRRDVSRRCGTSWTNFSELRPPARRRHASTHSRLSSVDLHTPGYRGSGNGCRSGLISLGCS